MSKILEPIQDKNEKLSSTRIIALIIALVFILTWSYTCVVSKKFISLEGVDVTFLLGMLGIKLLQSNIENS